VGGTTFDKKGGNPIGGVVVSSADGQSTTSISGGSYSLGGLSGTESLGARRFKGSSSKTCTSGGAKTVVVSGTGMRNWTCKKP